MSHRTPQSSLKLRARARQPGSASASASGSGISSASKHSRSGSITNSVVERTVAYKESIEERQSLEKANFDLKMKVFYLEDALKRFTGEDGDLDGSGAGAGPHKSYEDLKKELDEKNNEIELKNVLILKAKAAIEALKSETQKYKADEDELNTYTKSLEERCVKATENEIMITAEFRKQHLKLEGEFAQLRTENEEKSIALAAAEAKVALLQKQNDEFETMRRGVEEERNEFYKEVLAVKDGDGSLQGQLAQAQAHNKLFEEQIHSLTSENEEFKREIAALIERKTNVESDQTRMIVGLQQQLRDLRVEYEQSVLQLSEEHDRAIKQTKMDFAHNWTMNDQLTRQNDRNEFMLMKEEWQDKINSKHRELEIHQIKHDQLVQQMNDMNNAVKEKTSHIEELNVKITEHYEQHRILTDRHESLSSDYKQIHTEHTSTKTERDKWEQKHDELNLAHGDTKTRLNELQVLVGSLETENKHLLKDVELYKRKCESLEDLSRDNERLKYDHMVVTRNHAELEGVIHDHETHRERLINELDDHKIQIRGHMDKIKDQEETHKILQSHKLTSEQSLQYERDRASAAEEKVSELQMVIDDLREEVSSHQETIGTHTTKLNDHSARTADLTNALSSMFNSINDWEAVITIVLEGVDSENSRGSPIHHNDVVEDPSTSMGFLSMTSFDLVSKISSRTERMDGKIARLVKLRKTIDSQMGKLLSIYTEKLGHANDKCALLEYKATDLERGLDEARGKINTHNGHLSTHTKRFEEFREKVSADHTARVQELVDNHSALQHIHELEKRKCYTASEELEKAKEEIVELKELVEKYVAQEEKMEEVSETNRLLSFEVDDRGEKLKGLLGEHDGLVQEFRVLQQKEAEEGALLEKQAQHIRELEERVHYLSSRQMDPTLQQTIMQTQGMLQYHIDSKSSNPNADVNPNVSSNWQSSYMSNGNGTMGDIIEKKYDDPNLPLSTSSLLTSSTGKYRFNSSPPNLRTAFVNSSNVGAVDNGVEPVMTMSYSRGSFNPSPPNLKRDMSESTDRSTGGERDLSGMMTSTNMMSPPASLRNGSSDYVHPMSSARRNSQFDVSANIYRPGADLSGSLPASRLQDPATSFSYPDRGSVQLQDPTPNRRLDAKTMGVGMEEQKEGNMTFPYRGSNVVVNSSSPPQQVSSRWPPQQQQFLSASSSSSSSYAARGGTISIGAPRGADDVNPMAFNIIGSSAPDSGMTSSSRRWELSNSTTPLQRQSLSRLDRNLDSLSNRLEDIEHRKSKVITKVMHH